MTSSVQSIVWCCSCLTTDYTHDCVFTNGLPGGNCSNLLSDRMSVANFLKCPIPDGSLVMKLFWRLSSSRLVSLLIVFGSSSKLLDSSFNTCKFRKFPIDFGSTDI